ncbi:MAG: acyltransferase [Alphaproteobacteria bacterium]|nr:acyltransferase [Alphaproteobacteria bacterium]
MKNRFEALDSWRGICALMVALLHLEAFSHFKGIDFFQDAYLFVDFFFVLSGFVIAANYLDRLSQGYRLDQFMLLRFGRLYPLYFTVLLAFLTVTLGQSILTGVSGFDGPRHTSGTIFANLFLLQSLNVFGFLTWNAPGWSIATEFWTCLLFALVARFAFRSLAACMVVVISICTALILRQSPHGMNTTYDYGMLRCMAGFAAGVLTFKVWQRVGHITVPAQFGLVVEAVTVLGVFMFVALAGQGPVSLLAPLVFSGVVLVFAKESSLISAALKTRPLIALGTLSYSIYMVHMFIAVQLLNIAKLVQTMAGVTLLSRFSREGAVVEMLGQKPLQGDVWTIAFIVIVIGVSALTYRLIEVPSRDWFRRLNSTPRPVLVVQAARP